MSLHEKMTDYESQLKYYGVFKRPAELKLLLEEIPKSRGHHVKITVRTSLYLNKKRRYSKEFILARVARRNKAQRNDNMEMSEGGGGNLTTF